MQADLKRCMQRLKPSVGEDFYSKIKEYNDLYGYEMDAACELLCSIVTIRLGKNLFVRDIRTAQMIIRYWNKIKILLIYMYNFIFIFRF